MKLFGNTGKSQYSSGRKKTLPVDEVVPAEEHTPLSLEDTASEEISSLDSATDHAGREQELELELHLMPDLDGERLSEEKQQEEEPSKLSESPDADRELMIEGLSQPETEEILEEPVFSDTPEIPEENTEETPLELNIAEDALNEIEDEQIKNELFRELNLIIEERKEDLTDDQPQAITGKPPRKLELAEKKAEEAPVSEDKEEETEEGFGFSGHAIGLVVLTVSLLILGFVVYMVADKLLA